MQPQKKKIFYVYFDIFKMAQDIKKCNDTFKENTVPFTFTP